MKTETIEKIFNFLEEKEGKEIPHNLAKSIEKLKFIKFINELENHPDGVQYRYDGDLFLSDSNIKKLPNDLYVDGRLSLANCGQFKKLPDNLYVGRSLNLYDCEQLAKLPDNLYVGRNLNISYTNITELPNKLYVGGDLYINNTPLERKYTNEEIREIVTSTGGQIIGDIIRF